MSTLFSTGASPLDFRYALLNQEKAKQFWLEYRKLLSETEIECPPPDEKERNEKRGRLKRSKSRNLLERLIKYDEDRLRFMENAEVPFTNNQGELDIRMTKVQQKISGAFRSLDGAKMFCSIRGYLSTCKKTGSHIWLCYGFTL